MNISRRRFVGVVSLGICGLAGCQKNSVADIEIFNETTAVVTAAIVVVRLSDNERTLEEAFTLPPGGPDDYEVDKTYKEVVGDDETVRIEFTVQDGPEGTHEFTDSIDTRGMDISIYPERIEFQQVVA